MWSDHVSLRFKGAFIDCKLSKIKWFTNYRQSYNCNGKKYHRTIQIEMNCRFFYFWNSKSKKLWLQLFWKSQYKLQFDPIKCLSLGATEICEFFVFFLCIWIHSNTHQPHNQQNLTYWLIQLNVWLICVCIRKRFTLCILAQTNHQTIWRW